MRKEETVIIDAPGRDKDKVFKLKEMPASQAESWAIRAFLALTKSGVEVPEDIAQAGLAGIAQMGLKAFGGLSYEDAEPLLAEMMACVKRINDPGKSDFARPLVEDDLEEVKTRLYLRAKVLELHTGFSLPAVASQSTPPAAG